MMATLDKPSTPGTSTSDGGGAPPPGLMYGAVYGAFGAMQPFLAVQLEKERGLTASHLGRLASACALASFLSSAVASVTADRTRRHRDLLRGACLLAASLAPLLPLLPASPLPLCFLVLLLNIVWSPIVPLVDDAVMEDLGAANKKHEYGRHRMWGSIGFGVASGLMGWWLTFHEWVWSLWVFAAAMVGLASIFHYSNMRFPTGRPQVQYAQILTLLTAFRFQCFLAAIFVFGLSHSVASGFLFLFLKDLGATESLMGVATIAQTLAEIPVMFWSSHMLSRYGSRAVIVAAMVLYGLRMLGTTFLSPGNTTALVLPLQLLGGLAFGLAWPAGLNHLNALAASIASPSLGATAQVVGSGVFGSLSGFVGGLVGGWAYQALGPRQLFHGLGVLLISTAICFFLIERAITTPSPSDTRAK